jgi:hypothetical protein
MKIVNAIDALFLKFIVPVVADYSMRASSRPSVNGRMTDSCVGRDIIKMRIFTVVSFPHQPFEAIVLIFFIKSSQVVIAHLINDNTHDQLGPVKRIIRLGPRLKH